jgi:hypothetical protein
MCIAFHDGGNAMQETDRYLTRRELPDFLRQHGFPISGSSLAKLSMPSRAEGPPAEGSWGSRHLYRADRVLEWARARIKPIDATFCSSTDCTTNAAA